MKFRGKSWRLLIFFTRTGTHINTYKVLPPISSWFLIHSRLCGRYSPAWHSRQSGAPNETHPGLKPPMATFQDQQNLATKINIKICGWIKQLPIFFNDHFNIFCWECVTISPIPSVRLREIHVWCCKSVCLCSYMQTQCKYTYLRCILWVVSSRIRDSEFMAEIIFLGDPLDEETSNTMDDPSWMTWKMPGKYQDTWRGLSNYPEAGGYNCEYKGACTVIRGLLAVACVQQIPVWNFVNVYAQLLFHWNSTLQKQTPETLPPCL